MRETTTTIGKLEYKVEMLRDKAEAVADHVAADFKLELIGANIHDEAEARNYKDTHVNLSMEIWILHNKSRDCESITLLTMSILRNSDLVCEDMLPVSFGFPGKVDCIEQLQEVPFTQRKLESYFDAVKEWS